MKNLCFLLGVLFTSWAHAQAPVTTVASVDLDQYVGKWYEIAAIPQFFERNCVGNTSAEYQRAPEGLISVVNRCDESNGKTSVANGRAKVVDPTSNAKLEVTFVHLLGWQFLFGGDYWILALGKNYAYAVVGSPNRKYAWILSRTPALSPDLLAEAALALKQQSFDPCALISTPQQGGFPDRQPLCKLISAP